MTTPRTFTSNGVAVLADDRTFAPMRDSTSLLEDSAALRARYEDDGYLYLRGVLDADAVGSLRAAYFSEFDPLYLRAGTSPGAGIFSGTRPEELPAHGVSGHPAHAFVRGETFDAFASQPALANLASRVLGGPVNRLPRAIVRHFDRSRPIASRAHLDYSYLDRGSDRLVTLWVPIGDCPPETGGLVYLEGSHREGKDELDALRSVTDRPDDRRAISHDLGWVARRLGRRWLWADYDAGDVAVHSPHIVHASLDTTTDAMRLSADLRFIRSDETADERWLKPWAGDDGN